MSEVKIVSHRPEVLERIVELAKQCGFEGEQDHTNLQYVVCFGLPGGRTQAVHVGDSSWEPEVNVITVHSPCLVIEKGLFKGIKKDMAVDLLLLNEKLNFARYGIQEDKESYIVVASCDLLLDSLDAVGFEAALECVALAADSYEAKFGQDLF